MHGHRCLARQPSRLPAGQPWHLAMADCRCAVKRHAGTASEASTLQPADESGGLCGPPGCKLAAAARVPAAIAASQPHSPPLPGGLHSAGAHFPLQLAAANPTLCGHSSGRSGRASPLAGLAAAGQDQVPGADLPVLPGGEGVPDCGLLPGLCPEGRGKPGVGCLDVWTTRPPHPGSQHPTGSWAACRLVGLAARTLAAGACAPLAGAL